MAASAIALLIPQKNHFGKLPRTVSEFLTNCLNFSSVNAVGSAIEDLKKADKPRADRRGLIDELYNGFPPYSKKEAEENHVLINVDFKEGQNLMLQSRQQLENAHLATAVPCRFRIPSAPSSKKQEYETGVTEEYAKIIKSPRSHESLIYLHRQREKFGTVCVHGVGPQLWEDQWKWLAYTVGIEDLLFPTDTEVVMDDLGYFAVRRRMTPGKLYRKTIGMGDKVDPGWNMGAVRKVLDAYKDVNSGSTQYNWTQHPEKMQELVKQNLVQYDRDSVPKIGFFDFYYRSEEDDPCWYKCMILDSDCVQTKGALDPNQFIYKRQDYFAKELGHILHIQFADGNIKAPYEYYSIRSLGYILFDTLQLMNRLRCQFSQRVFDDMMHLFRVQDPADRSRLDQIYFGLRYGILPEGLSMIGEKDRGPLDPQQVEMLMANYKQLLGESAAPYNQELDTGTSKERTAFEVQTLLAQGTKLTGSLLNLSYLQESYAYQEMARRLTIKNSPDFTAKKFQNALRERGIPDKFIDAERWEAEPERVLGGGNTQMELAQAQGLMNIRQILNPEAQQRVTHKYVFALTHDPKEADLLVPLKPGPMITDSIHDAELAFGTLMNGTQVSPKAGLNPIETVETILKLMGNEVQRINQTGGVGTPEDLTGLMAAAKYVTAFIQQIAQDKAEKARVKQYMDALGQITNMAKAFAQRQQEAAQKAAQQNGHMDPETMVKLQAQVKEMELKMQEMTMKLQHKDDTHRQKMQQKAEGFAMDEQRKNAESIAQVHRDSITAVADATAKAQAEKIKAKSKPAKPKE